MTRITNLFRQRHEFELKRKQEIVSSIPLPVGVISIIGGLLAAMIKGYSWSIDILNFFFVLPTVFSMLALLVCVSFLIFVYWGHETSHTASSQQLWEWYSRLLEHYKTEEDDESLVTKWSEEALERELAIRYVESSTLNAQTNDRRSLKLYQANLTLIFALVFCGLSGMVYTSDLILSTQGIENNVEESKATTTTSS